MSKNRTLEDVLVLYDDLHRRWALLYAKQEAIRRQVYPKQPKAGTNIHSSKARTCIAIYYPEFEYNQLYVYSFGWTTYRNNITDSWHASWFSGPEGRDIWEAFHKGESFPETNEEALAWTEGWKLCVGYSEKKDKLAREYRDLETRSRTLSDRNHSLLRAIRRYVFCYIEEQGHLRYTTDGSEKYRFQLPDGRMCHSEGDSFYMSDCAKTIEIPSGVTTKTEDSGYAGAEGTNTRLKHKLRELRRAEKEKKHGKA
jgi:hypothetical protein